MSNVGAESTWTRGTHFTRKYLRKGTKAVMRSHHVRLPKYDMPVRFRPWFFLLTCVVMLILGLLGFSNISHALPINDKLLHFFCFMLATGIFYFIFDVEDDARRIWIWRMAPLLFTGFACFFLGGIMSEFVQGMLPYKEFDFGDIVANLLGASIGLYVAYHLELYYRHRREISRLYRPIVGVDAESEDEEDLEAATQLLPTHASSNMTTSKSATKASRLGDVWDEGEDLFDIGGDSDDEAEPGTARGVAPTPATHLPSPHIVVTSSS